MKPKLFPRGIPHRKRLLDLALTSLGLVVIAPILAAVGVLVALDVGRPIWFRQRRPGYRGKPFTLFKFRTMREARDGQGKRLPDDRRITGWGRFLRATSLDELPELFNVLRGEMSLVGPRPLLMEYLDRYTPDQARRHEVLPGITGWAQVNGRNDITWEEKFRLDVWYVDHWSLALDVRILLLTLGKVLRREGISQPGHISAEKFRGSPGGPTKAPKADSTNHGQIPP